MRFSNWGWVAKPETHTKRQASQHGCLPSMLSDGEKGIEIVYGEEKNILYRQGRIKISFTVTTSLTNHPRKDLFHFYSLSPHLPQFHQSAGATTL
jgi:hypothetical protein